MNLPLRLFLVLACLLCASVTARAASITNVGLFPTGEYSEVDGINGDGSVAVGYGDFAGNNRAFRWTATSGTLQNLGVLPDDSASYATAVSGDGSVVVGQSSNQGLGIARAFRWIATSGTMEDLGGVPDATSSVARAVTPDGSTVVGTSSVSVSSDMAVRWTSGTIQSLGLFPGGTRSLAQGVSHDGSVVVGYANDAADTFRAYRWTVASGTLQDLGTLPGGSGTTQTLAWGVNGDGSVVVGAQGVGAEMRAFRWTLASGTMQDLGLLPDGINARAWAVSADGATIVGEAEDAAGLRAFLWTPTLGMQDLNSYLPSLGVDLTDWVLESAYTVSADGTTVGGYGYYQDVYSGFVANITPVPEPSTWAMALGGLAWGGFMMRRQRTRACRNRAVRLVAVIVALCYLTLPRAADAGTLYVADRINNVVAAYNGTTGAVINSSFITGLNNPWFMTRDSDGNFYVTNRNSNSVGKYAPDGTVINASFISASDPMGVAVDNAGRLFLSVGSNVRTYDATTGALINSSFISGLNSPRPLALDGAGNLFVGEYFGSTVGKYDAATGAAVNASLITGFVTPLGLAFDATGTLFVSSLGNPGVQSFNASTGSAISAVRLGGFNGTFGLAFDESNNFFVSRYSDGFVAKLTATGSTVTNPLITLSALGPTSLVYVGAVPEPSTVAMALGAIACGGWSLWRRKRRTCPNGRCVAIAASLALVATLLSAGSTQAAPVTIDWVTVGNPGNAADGNGRGRVNDAYRIGKYEVTIGQYTEFLNAVAATDTYSLYDMGLIFNASVRGIQRNGVSGSYQYISLGSANKPVAFITWWDAARFANWMHNGQPTGPQGIGTTETGAYTLNGATSGAAPARNPGATVFLPTSDEWYKAAYYSPTKSGTGGYYTYAMQSDTNPGNVVGSNANQANFKSGGGTIYSVTQSSTFDSNQNYLTDAGAFTNSASYYGTFDQNGNVSEWSSPTAPASNIANWGGSWRWGIVDLMKGSPSSAAPDYRDEGFGFRLAAVPEPSTVAMALGAIACGGWSLWRRTRRETR